jgi:hypothetical protein
MGPTAVTTQLPTAMAPVIRNASQTDVTQLLFVPCPLTAQIRLLELNVLAPN